MGWYGELFPSLAKPIIAAINGVCVGAGLGVALSSDIRIASEAARFGAVQILRGVVPDWGLTYLLPDAVGLAKGLELMYTGEIISSAEAERLGIVSRVVSAEALMDTARELGGQIAKQAPVVVELTKKITWRHLLNKMKQQIDLETYAQGICRQTEDHHESVRAFFEKRPPVFKGK